MDKRRLPVGIAFGEDLLGAWMTARRWMQIVSATMWIASTVAPATAADIVVQQHDEFCKLQLSGPIEHGDFKKFVTLAKSVFTPLEEVGESTSANTICLDSPGGLLVEGMRFARYFYDNGVGTVILKDQLCASACALMFTMGRAVGPEVSFTNRKLHIGGLLGFHRPSLHLPSDEAFGSRDIEASYDMAVDAVVEFVALANRTAPWSNRPMVLSDLVEKIFATPGNDMFFIDTVEKAARWNIELVGVRLPTAIDEERAYLACENALQWEVALHDDPLDFVGLNLGVAWGAAYSHRVPGPTGQRFAVTSAKAGYASAGCVVEFDDQGLRICGNDEYTGTTIGSGDCAPETTQRLRWVNPLALWPPTTKLVDMNAPWTPQVKEGTCTVHSAAGVLSDEEACVLGISFDYSEGQVAVTRTFVWPSGSLTRVRSVERSYQLNGDAAQTSYVEGQDACYVNSRTGNRFCFDGE